MCFLAEDESLVPNSLGLVSNRPPTKLCSVAILFRVGWSFKGSGLEFVYLGRFYLQYSLGSGVCLPGHVLFTIQSWVWSLFTWARLIYNTVLGLEFVYLGMLYLQYSLGKKHRNQGMYKLRHINIVIPLVSYEYGLQALCTFNDEKIPSHKRGKTSWKKKKNPTFIPNVNIFIYKRGSIIIRSCPV